VVAHSAVYGGPGDRCDRDLFDPEVSALVSRAAAMRGLCRAHAAAS
jgi:hypothetical protein